MHYYSADFIFPIHLEPIKNGVLIIDNDGKVLDLLDPLKQEIPESGLIRKFNGIICPGFVNSHCHLELSHLRGKLSEGKGLPNFISEMVEKRAADSEIINEAMQLADAEMFNNGIVAVGDISNSPDSIQIKSKSRILYHTCIELFDLSEDRSENVFKEGKALKEKFNKAGLINSIVPHAPFTVTQKLLKLIVSEAKKEDSIICIHNQETEAENEMFERGSGILIERLRLFNKSYEKWIPSGKSSLKSIISILKDAHSLQLVHNTFSRKEDIKSAQEFGNFYWCLCPNANLFIEKYLPDVPLLLEENCTCTIGTDSLASNYSLSVFDEIKLLQRHFPLIKLKELLKMSTLNGAAFLGVEKTFGSFEKGKIPGLILISGVDDLGHSIGVEGFIKRVF
jgi:cytosine/adenosine deaminase-related metal-dependent hydrolase